MIQVAVGVVAPPIRIARAAPCLISSNVTDPRSLVAGSGKNEASDNSMSQAPARNSRSARAGLKVMTLPFLRVQSAGTSPCARRLLAGSGDEAEQVRPAADRCTRPVLSRR